MDAVANIHIRDVPAETVEALKTAAKRRRRSLNAEIVATLDEHAARERRSSELLQRLEEGRRIWRQAYPDGFPPGLEPETIIRKARDSR